MRTCLYHIHPPPPDLHKQAMWHWYCCLSSAEDVKAETQTFLLLSCSWPDLAEITPVWFLQVWDKPGTANIYFSKRETCHTPARSEMHMICFSSNSTPPHWNQYYSHHPHSKRYTDYAPINDSMRGLLIWSNQMTTKIAIMKSKRQKRNRLTNPASMSHHNPALFLITSSL
jgi:hypothetical protein